MAGTTAAVDKAANVYTGSSILTPGAGSNLQALLETYLTKRYCLANPKPASTPFP